jgi:hypothetical protein
MKNLIKIFHYLAKINSCNLENKLQEFNKLKQVNHMDKENKENQYNNISILGDRKMKIIMDIEKLNKDLINKKELNLYKIK